ncbi:MAG: NmrA family NAD(P)-binding protein, partial [Bacillota bacterium]
ADRMPFLPHAKIEKAILAAGLDYTFLRPAFFFQNLSTTYARMIRETGEVALPVGRARMSWIDSRDIGAAGAIALMGEEHRNKAYTLTEKAYDFDQVAAIFARELNRPIRYTRPSVFRYRRLMRSLGAPEGIINLTTMMYVMARLGLSADVTDDLGRILGREPLSMAQFVRDYAAVWTPG